MQSQRHRGPQRFAEKKIESLLCALCVLSRLIPLPLLCVPPRFSASLRLSLLRLFVASTTV
jgi:hypothetical protein